MNNKLPEFTEEKLKELLHYTDQEENPSYDAYKSNAFYKIYSGAKGVSKSFGRMIETVYRIVNEKNFCSVWCRNQYNHIKTTLKPTLEKVLTFLAEEHSLDYRQCFYITNEAAFWNYEDEGQGRAIYFQNWEKIQAFQGLTLKKPIFRFGELVIDEPLEDSSDSNKLPHQLQEIYQVQEEKLPLLLANTVLREAAPEGFQVNVTFLYNIFTTEHFLIRNYHNKAIPLETENGELNNSVLEELIKNNFIQVENLELFNGLGIIATMFSKNFVPKKVLGEIQIKNLEIMKETNYRLWVITVAGFANNFEDSKLNYFMKSILYNEKNEINKKAVKIVSKAKLIEELQNGQITGVYFGFDPGIHDNAALVGVAFKENGEIFILEAIEDIKKLIPKKVKWINKAINTKVVEIISKWNEVIEKNTPNDWIKRFFAGQNSSIMFCDNHATIEAVNILFEENNINSQAVRAVRKPSQRFGIEDRQTWQKNIFENNLVYFLKDTEILVKYLAKQVVIAGEKKRDENINPEIYDLVNAFEMSCSWIFKAQYRAIIENKQRRLNGSE
ncbi:hypothetical protein [[Mycoplasma] gypis]|uniref:hypothetical protein n=1 Tax=[Mycoplasma] gypis TaxID=92404 RepID=UPI00196777BF|nr:hypothetical protein [[Mycoplasma] gypis]MBN0919678.1 hypothetical protein [[Mycoplasma] gypis]